ncbi:hypothetical protein C9374_002316 [Naegleria lovaniensis]|uniref:RGS domain-containing protein n=1 Tax=Naegleria lovaniensis TaxID=51637 RepID=A0AA88GPN2_NAELO|nr:uncharacterized protein C9374_002316 [Naegleria lovaniensis]KAG2386572.1 hypothetical protein C9374_002316 [Naegleria lovaniensis]
MNESSPPTMYNTIAFINNMEEEPSRVSNCCCSSYTKKLSSTTSNPLLLLTTTCSSSTARKEEEQDFDFLFYRHDHLSTRESMVVDFTTRRTIPSSRFHRSYMSSSSSITTMVSLFILLALFILNITNLYVLTTTRYHSHFQPQGLHHHHYNNDYHHWTTSEHALLQRQRLHDESMFVVLAQESSSSSSPPPPSTSPSSCILSQEQAFLFTQLHDFKFTPNLYGTWRLKYSNVSSTTSLSASSHLVPCPDLFEITTISVSATIDRMTYFAVSMDIIHNKTEFESDLWGVAYQPRFRNIFFELHASTNLTRTHSGSYLVEMKDQYLVSNETREDGSYASLVSGSQVFMTPLFMRKMFYGFEYTIELKLQDLFNMLKSEQDNIPPPSIQTFLTSLSFSNSSNNSSSSMNMTNSESIFKLKMLVSKFDLPFTFPLIIKQPLGTNSILLCAEISLKTLGQTELSDLNFQKSLIQVHHAISTIIVVINATLSIIVLSLLVILRKSKPRESRGYLPYVIFIQIFVNFVRLLLQTYWGDEFLLLVFVFSTMILLCFSYLMYFLNTLVVFYKRKVYNDWYKKMKRESLDKQKKQKTNASVNQNTIAIVVTSHGDATPTLPSAGNHFLTPLTHENADSSNKSLESSLHPTSSSSAITLHSNSSGELLLQPSQTPQTPQPQQHLLPQNSVSDIDMTATTAGVAEPLTLPPQSQQSVSQQKDSTLENTIANHLSENGLDVSSGSMSILHEDVLSKTELGSIWWVKSRRVKICSTIFVAFLVSLSLVAILPVFLLTGESVLQTTVLSVLGFYFLVASAMAIGALSFDMAWNWKRIIKRCEWKKYFFRNDPLYYRLELVIHFFSIFQFIASVAVLFIVRDRVDNISLLNNKTYSSTLPTATFASLPIEFTAVVFEILASGGGFICIMTLYEKYKMLFESEQDDYSHDTHSKADQNEHQEEPPNAQVEIPTIDKKPSNVKFRTNIFSPLLELLGDDLGKLFVDEKGFELLRLFSRSEFSMENLAFINDMEKIYTLLFCDINESRKLSGSGAASPTSSSLSKSYKPTLRQNLSRDTIEKAKQTVCEDFYNLYVSENAKLSVNFSNQSKMIFNKWKQNGWNDEYIKSDEFPNDLDYITLDVVKNVRDTFRRFQLTQSYKEWKIQSRKNIQVLKSALRQAKKSPVTIHLNNGNGATVLLAETIISPSPPAATSTSPTANNASTTIDVNTVKLE